MTSYSSALLVLAALVATGGCRVQLKRGVPAYSTGAAGQPAYTKAFRAAPELRAAPAAQQYVSQPAAYSGTAQQYYQQQAEQSQAEQYLQPSAGAKYAAAPAPQKYSFASQPQYSSAADVSSFSYSSPLVSYNNLGFLHQIIGKGAGGQQPQQQQQQQQVAYSTAQSPKVQYITSPSQYSQGNYEVPTTYQAVAQKAAYADASQAQQYQADVQAQAYAQAAQAQALADAQAQAKAQAQAQQPQAQAVTYQSTSPVAAQKFSYSGIPGLQALQKASPQVNYVGSQQQVAYRSPQASQTYETAAQSAPQLFYSQQASQPQYYSVPQTAKYAKASVTYAQ